MRIDHVIYAASDLVAATTQCETEFGVPAAGGGVHDGLGTRNRILPFGAGYLEVLAVADADEAAASPLGRALQHRLDTVGEGLWAWAVVVEDIEPVAVRLNTDVLTLTRDGFSARLTGVAEAMRDPGLPFFIARDQGVPDPGGDRGGALAWVEVATDAERLQAHLGPNDVDVRVSNGTPGVLAFGRA
jgi:hypothetical protein